MRSAVEEIAIIANAKSKASDTKRVVYTQQVVGFDQAPLGIFGSGSLLTLQAAFHQQSPPSVWTGVGKQPE